MSGAHLCFSDDLHPYECGGNCIHCRATQTARHNPRQCWLCWDGDPDGPPGPFNTVPPEGGTA